MVSFIILVTAYISVFLSVHDSSASRHETAVVSDSRTPDAIGYKEADYARCGAMKTTSLVFLACIASTSAQVLEKRRGGHGSGGSRGGGGRGGAAAGGAAGLAGGAAAHHRHHNNNHTLEVSGSSTSEASTASSTQSSTTNGAAALPIGAIMIAAIHLV